MWFCNICLDIGGRSASCTKPGCHMACAGMSHRRPLLYPSFAAFDYLAVAVHIPSCRCVCQIIIKMTLSQCELLSHGHKKRHIVSKSVHKTHVIYKLYSPHRKYTHIPRCYGQAEAERWLCGGWPDQMSARMGVYNLL